MPKQKSKPHKEEYVGLFSTDEPRAQYPRAEAPSFDWNTAPVISQDAAAVSTLKMNIDCSNVYIPPAQPAAGQEPTNPEEFPIAEDGPWTDWQIKVVLALCREFRYEEDADMHVGRMIQQIDGVHPALVARFRA